MKNRYFALALFTDGENIIVQERGKHSKVGEIYGFFGGEIEKGETKEETIKRELQEELGFIPEKLKYVGTYPFVVKEKGEWEGRKVNLSIFLSPITSAVENAEIAEGTGLLKMKIDKVIKGNGFAKNSTYFLKTLKKSGKLLAFS